MQVWKGRSEMYSGWDGGNANPSHPLFDPRQVLITLCWNCSFYFPDSTRTGVSVGALFVLLTIIFLVLSMVPDTSLHQLREIFGRMNE